jgi:hypothetical protein
MDCERATLVALLREAEADLASARERRNTAATVRAARAVHDLEREVIEWDRAYDARLRIGGQQW